MNVDPDLPILDELGVEFDALVVADLGAAVSANGHRERARLPLLPPPAPRRRMPRIARRAVVVLVLLCLVGSVALAARFDAGGKPAHTSPVTLGTGSSAGWRLLAYRDRGRLCVLFTAPGAEPTSECGLEQPAGGLRALSAIAGSTRFVFGLAGPEVDAVRVSVGSARASGTTEAPEDPSAAREAGAPAGTRWFVVPLEASTLIRERAPATVTPLDAERRRLGAAYVDCSLGVVGAACRRQIAARAKSAAE